MKAQTKGNKVIIDFGGRRSTFTAGGRKRYTLDDGLVVVNGLIRFADGTEAHCVLEIGEHDSGEHFGTGVFTEGGGFVWQGEDGFLSALGKTEEQVYPYKYKYTVPVNCYDHHIGDDGWSL